MQLHKERSAVAQVDLRWLVGTTFVTGTQFVQAHVNGALQQGGAQIDRRQVQQGQASAVGADDPAVVRKGNDAFGHRPNAFRVGVQVQTDMAPTTGDDQAVFNHARRRADQPQRVRMPAALLSGDVEDAQQFATGRHDGRSGAGQETVAFKKVLGAVDFDRAGFGQRGADGVGAAMLLVP